MLRNGLWRVRARERSVVLGCIYVSMVNHQLVISVQGLPLNHLGCSLRRLCPRAYACASAAPRLQQVHVIYCCFRLLRTALLSVAVLCLVEILLLLIVQVIFILSMSITGHGRVEVVTFVLILRIETR